jgi:hypothetical protein
MGFFENMKNLSQGQKNYGGQGEIKPPQMDAAVCPNCGAGRSRQDGLTCCAYCGYRFIDTVLSDGIFIKKEDNS